MNQPVTTADPWASPFRESPTRIGPDTDWETAMASMCAVRAGRRSTTVYEEQWFAVKRLGPALRAARLGHTVEWDPPAGLTSVQARWTCIHPDCGAAVLVGP